MSILITNGRVVTATDDYYADVYIEGETVKQIGKDLAVNADETLDAKGKLVIPGGIDPHTHLDMPFGGTVSADDFETGTIAAAHGGTTTLVDFAIQTKGESTLAGLEAWHEKANGKATIDYGFHMIITDMPDERLAEMTRLRDEGVTSYKLFMAYPGVLYVDDGTLYRAFRKAGEDGTRICMHAENGIVIDEIIKAAVADGKTEPALARPHAPDPDGGRGRPPRHRHRRGRGRAPLHRALVLLGRPRRGQAGPGPRRRRGRRDVPPVPLPRPELSTTRRASRAPSGS